MSSQKEVIDHLIDIKTDIAVIKTQLSDLPNLKAEVKQNSHDILKAHTQVRTIKFVLGTAAISIPAAIASYLKLFKS